MSLKLKYNIALLNQIIERDQFKTDLNIYESLPNLNGDTRVYFTCSCGEKGDKVFRQLNKCGGFCKKCTLNKSKEKIRETCFEKYGCENPSQSENEKQLLSVLNIRMDIITVKCNECNIDRLDYEVKRDNKCLYCYGKEKKISKIQLSSMINFYKRVNELGGKVIGEYINNRTKVHCICKNGHDREVISTNIQKGQGMCKICAGNDKETSKRNFYDNIKKLGGKVIGEYTKAINKVKCICKEGHDCYPTPNNIQQGRGMCTICVGNDPETAKQNFYDNIEKLEGKVIGEYINNRTKVFCICKNGHDCYIIPNNIKKGQGMCIICIGQDPETAKRNFYDNIEKLGGKIIGEYINNHTSIKCLCKKGHDCYPTPTNIQKKDRGMCLICAGNDPETAKRNFYDNIEKLGGKVIGEYINVYTKVKCICKEGHDCNPVPGSIQQGQGMCKICIGNDPETAKRNFYDNIEKLGGKVIGKYTKAINKVKCICKNGHDCHPIPSYIQRGGGMCNICITNGYSKVAIKWIESISKDIQHAENIGEYKINGTKYKADGYDEKTNTIYEFHGCFWHGCVKCFKDRDEINPVSKKTVDKLYKNTIKRVELFKNLGYNVVERWECEIKN